MSWLELGLSGLIVVAGGLSLLVTSQNLKAFRAMEENPLRGWDALEPSRQKSIQRALWRGEAVQDRDEAVIALDLAERQQRVLHLISRLAWIYTPLLAIFLVVGVLSPEWWFLAWFGGAFLALNALFAPFAWYQRRQAKRMVSATRRRLSS